ncbi:hypothetical protein M408DRAFT_17295 [Serendipita vermifera MAFF 305830]|uniref:Flavoprotein domain-containing protein n=1 Tax=Serendipita vermifera MAFF 305830 TaxID=933852 RepID=A0A0C2WG59_SERVB|nr:hypothetical protein M408DRAFT_17295 [Serendipita vermifera MAFF 305830]
MQTRKFIAAEHRTPGFAHVVLISTGSVASVKVPLIVEELLKYDRVKIQVVATKPSLGFFDAAGLQERTGVNVWQDEEEWTARDPILHIELRRWADLVLIAPCSANTLAKLAGGLCDNLATSMLRALPPMARAPPPPASADILADANRGVPVWVFPAMNTLMYEHPLTAAHLKIVTEALKYRVVGPIGKGLACGDVGLGAMTEWREIVRMVVAEFELQLLEGK